MRADADPLASRGRNRACPACLRVRGSRARDARYNPRTAMTDRDEAAPLDYSEQEQRQFMTAALEESRKALPACHPNPPVGCVIVRGSEIVARGFTGAPGTPHAEAAALLALGPDADPADLSAFVTLEPCAFVGRTPSCARALVMSGIPRVYVGTLDPDPRNNGAGIEIMRRAGIVVHVGVLKDAVLAFIAPYLLSAPEP
jgi:pyrimidine deaminase RibD-like protein